MMQGLLPKLQNCTIGLHDNWAQCSDDVLCCCILPRESELHQERGFKAGLMAMHIDLQQHLLCANGVFSLDALSDTSCL